MDNVSWSVSIALIALAAVHILEEAVKDFRAFFNTEWFDGNENCPVSRFKGLYVDKIGLFLILAASAVGASRQKRTATTLRPGGVARS